MAFVPGFEHDVFISYAHANNLRLTEKDQGFVTKLYEDLTLFLTAELGRREYFSIWLDKEELRGNDDFDAKLNASFLNSAVLVCVCSQSYVESAWCRRELNAFSSHKHARFGLKVGDSGSYRIFRVDLGEVVERHPDVPSFFFDRMLGHKLYEEIEGGVDIPFRRSDPAGDDQRYWNAVRRLAHDIAQLLRQMKKLARTDPDPVTVAAAKTVFLAETADDLEDQRDGVKSALEQQSQAKAALTGMGLRVLPEFPLSLGDPGLKDKLREALKGADMSVHLIGPLPGKTPVGETRPLVQLQWEVAREVARERPLPRVAWLCNDLDPSKVSREQHRAFLQSLEAEEGGAPPEVLRVGVEELRELLLGRLFPPPPPKPLDEPQEETEEIDRLVYLTYLPEDRDGAVKLKEALRRERLDVKLFRYEDRDPQMLARIHGASLEKSDGVVIFYGTNALWLDQLVEEARATLQARARKNPLKVVCICDGPPDPKDSPIDVDYDKFVVADCRDGIRPEDLKPFVELVKS
jgi:hypothetical protein